MTTDGAGDGLRAAAQAVLDRFQAMPDAMLEHTDPRYGWWMDGHQARVRLRAALAAPPSDSLDVERVWRALTLVMAAKLGR